MAKPRIPRKRLWLYFAVLSLFAIFLAVYFRSDAVFRGRPPYGVGSALFQEGKPKKPWINVDLPVLGRVTYPTNSLPFDVDQDDADPDSAGLLYAMDGLDIEKWRIGGQEFKTEVGWKVGSGKVGSRWNTTFIPFADSADERDAEVQVGGDWYPVVLPYEAGRKGPRKTQTFDTSLGVITAEPEPQPNRIANFKARLSSDSKPLLFIGYADFMRESHKSERFFLIGNQPMELPTYRSRPCRLIGEVHSFEEVPLKLRVIIKKLIVIGVEFRNASGSFEDLKGNQSKFVAL